MVPILTVTLMPDSQDLEHLIWNALTREFHFDGFFQFALNLHIWFILQFTVTMARPPFRQKRPPPSAVNF
jgi:hypothetical protein